MHLGCELHVSLTARTGKRRAPHLQNIPERADRALIELTHLKTGDPERIATDQRQREHPARRSQPTLPASRNDRLDI